MVLKSELRGWDVQSGTGEKLGTVRDLVVDTTSLRWPVKHVLLSRGVPRRRLLDLPIQEVEIDPRGGVLVRRQYTPLPREAPGGSALDHLRLDALQGAKVYDAANDYLGTAYDFTIESRPSAAWVVQRFLVQPPGVNTRRLRLSVADIAQVVKGKIVLKVTKETIPGAL